MMLAQRDHNHVTIYKTRRCFLYNDQYYQMDIYNDPCHPRCEGLILLETYSALPPDEVRARLPDFLSIVKEVTGEARYSMFNLSLKEPWVGNKHFCDDLATTNTSRFGDEAKHFKHANAPNGNGSANGHSPNNGSTRSRSESFIACSDEKSAKYFRDSGTVGYGKFKGMTNGTNGSGTATKVGSSAVKNGNH